MEELLGALGISGPALGAVVWYVKGRIVKNERALAKIVEELKASTNDNKIQEVQINQLKEDLRDLKKIVYGKAQG